MCCTTTHTVVVLTHGVAVPGVGVVDAAAAHLGTGLIAGSLRRVLRRE